MSLILLYFTNYHELHKLYLAHNVSFWLKKLTYLATFRVQKLTRLGAERGYSLKQGPPLAGATLFPFVVNSFPLQANDR